MYESRHAPLLPFNRFLGRMLLHAAIALTMMGVSLLAGMIGYIHFERLSPRDAFLNAAMLLGGMGPIKTDLTASGKLFAGCYALYCGLFIIAVMSVLLAPLLHRVMHKLHWDDKAGKCCAGKGGSGGRRSRYMQARNLGIHAPCAVMSDME